MEIDSNTEAEVTSRTQLKLEANRLQELGQKLTKYQPGFLQQLPLPDVLLIAIAEFNRLPNSHGARRRQLQFIGKLMRDCDFEEITNTIDKLENATPRKAKKHSETDSWADRILAGGDEEINSLLELHPQLSRQSLRQLQREYGRNKSGPKTESSEKQQMKFSNKLRNYLKEQLSP